MSQVVIKLVVFFVKAFEFESPLRLNVKTSFFKLRCSFGLGWPLGPLPLNLSWG